MLILASDHITLFKNSLFQWLLPRRQLRTQLIINYQSYIAFSFFTLEPWYQDSGDRNKQECKLFFISLPSILSLENWPHPGSPVSFLFLFSYTVQQQARQEYDVYHAIFPHNMQISFCSWRVRERTIAEILKETGSLRKETQGAKQ